MVFSTAGAMASKNSNESMFAINASAANITLTKPQFAIKRTYSDKIEINLKNTSSYNSGTVFHVYVSNHLTKKVKLADVKSNKNQIDLYNNGNHLRASTVYSVKIKAVNGSNESNFSDVIKAKTEKKTYFNINKNVQLYTVKDRKMVKSVKTDSRQSVVSELYNAKGTKVAGLSAKTYSSTYVKITEGKYKGKFAKLDSGKTVNRIPEDEAKRRIVSDYGAGMNGGKYVWGGSSYRATDCSGLTMQSYQQIGMNISHNARTQATKGKAVSRNNMKAGDIIVMNNYGHVAMYIGDNKMVHAMNSRDGIKVQSISYLQYYNINTVRRII